MRGGRWYCLDGSPDRGYKLDGITTRVVAECGEQIHHQEQAVKKHRVAPVLARATFSTEMNQLFQDCSKRGMRRDERQHILSLCASHHQPPLVYAFLWPLTCVHKRPKNLHISRGCAAYASALAPCDPARTAHRASEAGSSSGVPRQSSAAPDRRGGQRLGL
eukprot:3799298-Prymnesium_polylepis.1